MMWNNGMGWGGWLLMSVTTVAFWALVVFGIVALFRGTRDSGPQSPRRDEDSAQHILDERFAQERSTPRSTTGGGRSCAPPIES